MNSKSKTYKSLTFDDTRRIGFDDDGRFYIDGREVVTKSEIGLRRGEKWLAIITTCAILMTALAALGQAWVTIDAAYCITAWPESCHSP